MPWVKPVPPCDLADVLRTLIPTADIWVAGNDVEPSQSLRAAVDWAADHTENAGLVVIAGSLYLVADFYRTQGNDKLTGERLCVCGLCIWK